MFCLLHQRAFVLPVGWLPLDYDAYVSMQMNVQFAMCDQCRKESKKVFVCTEHSRMYIPAQRKWIPIKLTTTEDVHRALNLEEKECDVCIQIVIESLKQQF